MSEKSDTEDVFEPQNDATPLITEEPKPKKKRKPLSPGRKAKMLEVLAAGRIKAAEKRRELSELKKAKQMEEQEKNEAVLTKYRKKKVTIAEPPTEKKTIEKSQENNEPTSELSELQKMKNEMAELRKQLKASKETEEKNELKKELEQLKNELKQEVKPTPVQHKPQQQLPQKPVSAPVPIPPKKNVYSTYTGNIWGV